MLVYTKKKIATGRINSRIVRSKVSVIGCLDDRTHNCGHNYSELIKAEVKAEEHLHPQIYI